MDDPLYRGARIESLRIERLDAFTLIYHRASGLTHLVASPAPEILALLGEAGMTMPTLAVQLATHYDLPDADPGALAARLEELVACGLVSTS